MKRASMFLLFILLAGVVFATGNSEGKYKFGWYVPAPHPTFEANMIGVNRFIKETGITVMTQIGPDWNQANETQNVQAMAAKGVKQFAICPADGEAAKALFSELRAKGIAVINFCIPTTAPNPATMLIATDVDAAARQAAEALVKEMGGKGNVLNVLEMLSDTNTAIRKKAVEETVAKYPNVKIIQTIADMSTVAEATQKITDGLSSNIDKIDGIIATGFTTTIAICNTLSDYYARGGKKVVKAIGIDYDDTIIKSIKDGILFATIAQNPQGQSYLALTIMKYLADGWKVRDGAFYINAGTAVVTKNNVGTFGADIEKITAGIKADLETKYLVKK
jgi:ribose transport system substrate-binding protein